jgi:hypothetical protein
LGGKDIWLDGQGRLKGGQALSSSNVTFCFHCSGLRLQYAAQQRQQKFRHVSEHVGRDIEDGPVLRQVRVEKRDGPAGKDDLPYLPGEKLGQQDGKCPLASPFNELQCFTSPRCPFSSFSPTEPIKA